MMIRPPQFKQPVLPNAYLYIKKFLGIRFTESAVLCSDFFDFSDIGLHRSIG